MRKDHPCQYIAKSLGYRSWSRVVFNVRSGAVFSLKLPKTQTTTAIRKELEFYNKLVDDDIMLVLGANDQLLIGLRENLPADSVRAADIVNGTLSSIRL